MGAQRSRRVSRVEWIMFMVCDMWVFDVLLSGFEDCVRSRKIEREEEWRLFGEEGRGVNGDKRQSDASADDCLIA